MEANSTIIRWLNLTINETAPNALDFEPRCVAFSILGTIGLSVNILSLAALCHVKGLRTVHHVFLQNLAVCDILGTVLLWLYYNSPFIFPMFIVSRLEHCMFISLGLVAPFLLSLCSSGFALLMLALNQYMAICNPLFSATRISRGTACWCSFVSWLVAIALSVLPAFFTLAKSDDCARYASQIAVKAIEVCAYALTCLILIIIALYGKIYHEVLQYRKRIPQLQLHCPRAAVSPTRRSDAERNFKAFVTTFLLSGTLVIFWIPFLVIHFISAHIDYERIPDAVVFFKFYIVDLLPMFNFMTDPIIYGLRMKEIRCGYRRVFAKLFPKCVSEPRDLYTRNSVRFTTLETSI